LWRGGITPAALSLPHYLDKGSRGEALNSPTASVWDAPIRQYDVDSRRGIMYYER
jgi:hypothetical protein